jgi:hypothetical protein
MREVDKLTKSCFHLFIFWVIQFLYLMKANKNKKNLKQTPLGDLPQDSIVACSCDGTTPSSLGFGLYEQSDSEWDGRRGAPEMENQMVAEPGSGAGSGEDCRSIEVGGGVGPVAGGDTAVQCSAASAVGDR